MTSGFVPAERRWAAAGRFRLLARLAVDSVDTTYLGWWIQAEAPVVVKRVHEHRLIDQAFTSRVRDRAGRAVGVVHPNVVRTLGIVDQPGELAVVTEYLPSASLAEVLDATATRSLTPPIAVAVIASVLRGLAAAHDTRRADDRPDGILHGRLDRAGVLFGEDGVIRVGGFEKERVRPLADALGLVAELPYVSPEELAKGHRDARSDVYAASVLLWEALTGQALFGDDSIEAVVGNVLAAPVPPPSAFAPDVPHCLDRIVLRGLDRDPSARFASAHVMADELARETALASRAELAAFLPTLDVPPLSARRAAAAVGAARRRMAR